MPATIDKHAVDDLALFIENTGELYGQFKAIQKNLATKKVRSKYDHALAVKLFGYLVDASAKKYAKEFDYALPWHKVFNVPTRKDVAEYLTTVFEDEFEQGYYDDLLPKKYKEEMLTGQRRFPRGHATKRRKSPSQLDREIAASLGRGV